MTPGRPASASAPRCWRRTPAPPADTCRDVSSSSTPPRIVLGCAGAELHDRQHRIVVGRHVEDRRRDHQRPGARDAVGLARDAAREPQRGQCACRRVAARSTRPQVSQPIAPRGTRPSNARRVGPRRSLAVDRAPTPPRGRAPRPPRPARRSGRAAHRRPRRSSIVHQVAELHIGDEDAEARRPRSSTRGAAARPGEDAAQMARRVCLAQRIST